MPSSSFPASKPPAAAPDESTRLASWGRVLASSVRAAIAVMLIAGVAYPLATTGAAQLLFTHAANGSLIERDDHVAGSALIGQPFASAAYFHGRPGATASNQGATSRDLARDVAGRVARYRADNGLLPDVPVPVDAVTASASGLDPHISVANAMLQLPRVAQARALPQTQVVQLLAQATQPRTLGLLGEPRVNVLRLNLALDALASSATSTPAPTSATPVTPPPRGSKP
jgi:K+-transporting ATPase ATPase C chain